MKTFLAVLKAVAAGTAAIAATDASGLIHILPDDLAKGLAIGLSACAFVAHATEAALKALAPKEP